MAVRTRTKKATPIIELSEFDETKNLMVFGMSGVGKTRLAGTAPKALFVASESGTISAKRAGSTAKLWPIRSWQDFEECTLFLRNGGYAEYEWIINDSITALQELAMREALDRAVADNASRDPDIPARQDFYKVQNIIKRMVTVYCDLPTNCIFTALTMGGENDEGEEIALPQIHGRDGAIAQFVMGQMSAVGHMVVDEDDSGKKVRRIYWENDPPHTGKDRYDCLAPYTDGLSIPQIVSRIDRSGRETERTGGTTRRARTGRSARPSSTRRSAARKAS